jgi:hypothetical protein
VHRLDDHRLAASVRLLERYFESETSNIPATAADLLEVVLKGAQLPDGSYQMSA